MSIRIGAMLVTTTLIGLCVTRTAVAQPTTQVRDGDNGDYSYQFSDEDLLGTTLGELGDMFVSRHRFARVLLLRPRTTLVGEILKSVEEL